MATGGGLDCPTRAGDKGRRRPGNDRTSGEDVHYPNPPGPGESSHLPPGMGGQDGRHPVDFEESTSNRSTAATHAEVGQLPNAADATTTRRGQNGEGIRLREAQGVDKGTQNVTESPHAGGEVEDGGRAGNI